MEDCRVCEFSKNCLDGKNTADSSLETIEPRLYQTIDTPLVSIISNLQRNKFYKVSYDQFLKDCKKNLRKLVYYKSFSDDEFEKRMRDAYDHITLPCRSTAGSAGYDFYMPFDSILLYNNDPIVIPTGIKMELVNGLFLGLFPRSSYGYKYGMRLENTVGIIDADYYNNNDNEGHISAKISVHVQDNNDEYIKRAVLPLSRGDKYMQGIIMGYGLTIDDNPLSDKREGGIGSTGN